MSAWWNDYIKDVQTRIESLQKEVSKIGENIKDIEKELDGGFSEEIEEYWMKDG